MMNPSLEMLEIHRVDPVTLRRVIELDARRLQREAIHAFAASIGRVIARRFARVPVPSPYTA